MKICEHLSYYDRAIVRQERDVVLMIQVVIFAGLVICGLVAWYVYSQLKVKQKIRNEWGKLPSPTKYDKEDSLAKAYDVWRKQQAKMYQIDDTTWYDLDMWSVFQMLNKTETSVGSESLYQRLREYDASEDLSDLKNMMAFFDKHPETREKVQYHLVKMGKQDNNYLLTHIETPEKQSIPHEPYYWFLGAGLIASLLLTVVAGKIGLYLLLLFMCVNVLTYYRVKSFLETEFRTLHYLSELAGLSAKLKKTGVPLTAETRSAISEVQSLGRYSNAFRVSGTTEADILVEYVNIVLLLPVFAYIRLNRLLKSKQEAIRAVYKAVGQIEVALALNNFKLAKNICEATEMKSRGVEAVGLRHPLIDECVPNPVCWEQATLVTGSNASGKSTYVKAIAINLILAQTVGIAMADTFNYFPGLVMTAMAVEDDVLAGDSYFIAELKSLHRVISQVEDGVMVYGFIDEILKGTNTIERIASSASVMVWLSRSQALVLVATHDIELTEILHDTCANIHFRETISDEQGMMFDFKVRSGASTTSNAILLLDHLLFPQEIVQAANRRAADYRDTRVWT